MTTDQKRSILEQHGYHRVWGRYTHQWTAPADLPLAVAGSDDEDEALALAWEHYQFMQAIQPLVEYGKAYLSPSHGTGFGSYEGRPDDAMIDIPCGELRAITRAFFGLGDD